jgi:hypothetical protein
MPMGDRRDWEVHIIIELGVMQKSRYVIVLTPCIQGSTRSIEQLSDSSGRDGSHTRYAENTAETIGPIDKWVPSYFTSWMSLSSRQSLSSSQTPGPPAELLIGHARLIPPEHQAEFYHEMRKRYGK